MVNVRIKVLTPGAPAPSFARAGDAGADLVFWPKDGSDLWIHAGDRGLAPCGFAMELPPGWEAQVRPRSGLALRSGIAVVNAPGTIDAGYRGEVCVALVNLSASSYILRKGDRIAQLCVRPVPEVSFVVVDELGDSERGAGGFGSSGR